MTTRYVETQYHLGQTPDPRATCTAAIVFMGHPIEWQCGLTHQHDGRHHHDSAAGIVIEWDDDPEIGPG